MSWEAKPTAQHRALSPESLIVICAGMYVCTAVYSLVFSLSALIALFLGPLQLFFSQITPVVLPIRR